MKHINKIIVLSIALMIFLSCSWAYLYQAQQNNNHLTAIIYKDGQVIEKIILTKTGSKELKITDNAGHYNLIKVRNGEVRVKEADCSNKICIKTGWISKPGQIAVCMPNRLKVVIEGNSKQIDAVSF